jgi:Zn finger protein HypA/HybF involved in hydrogenase expression
MVDEMTDSDVRMYYERLVLFEEMGLFESMFDRGCVDDEKILAKHINDKLKIRCGDCGKKIRVHVSKCDNCGSREMELNNE